MKSFIQNINKTLLEKFPLVWNTRLLWMISIAALTHIIFFIFGQTAFHNRELLQHSNADQLYLFNGTLLLSIICSVLMIVVWLIVMFRNNSFKNYYPTSRWQLFASFLFYFIILLSSTTFYASYILGYQTYLNKQYPTARLDTQINNSNLAAAFLSFNQDDYTINNRKYPAPFDTLYCETNEDQIDFTKPYLHRFNDEYQFYTLAKKLIPISNKKEIADAYKNSIYQTDIADSTMMFVYRDQVIDVSVFADTVPSYFNYSTILFGQYGGRNYYSPEYSYRENYYGKADIVLNETLYKFLKRNDTEDFKKTFTSFLNVAKEFNIETNLTVDNWLPLIDRNRFTIQKFITNGKMSLDSRYAEDEIAIAAEDIPNAQKEKDTPENRNKKQRFQDDRETNYYFDAGSLQAVFQNIASIKDYNYWSFIFHFQCWLAFSLSILLFIFRTSGLPSLLFSVISGIVITILVMLVIMGFQIKNELAIAYVAFALGTGILLTPLLFLKNIKKQILAVFINLTLAGIVPYILLVLLIINLHLERFYKELLGDNYYDKKPVLIFDFLGHALSYVLLATGFIFVLVYTGVIKKWKALPEG